MLRKRSATLQVMATIHVGYGAGDRVVESEEFEVDGEKYNVRVADQTGALQIDGPGKIRIYAPGFWKYVDVDAQPGEDD